MKNKTMLTLALCALAVCAVSRPGYAALPSPRIPGMDYIALADAVPLSSDEMGNLRGGFIDPTGLIYNFAVNVQTALNGAEVFTRSLNISPSGPNGQMQATSTSSLLPNWAKASGARACPRGKPPMTKRVESRPSPCRLDRAAK